MVIITNTHTPTSPKATKWEPRRTGRLGESSWVRGSNADPLDTNLYRHTRGRCYHGTVIACGFLATPAWRWARIVAEVSSLSLFCRVFVCVYPLFFDVWRWVRSARSFSASLGHVPFFLFFSSFSFFLFHNLTALSFPSTLCGWFHNVVPVLAAVSKGDPRGACRVAAVVDRFDRGDGVRKQSRLRLAHQPAL